MRILFSFITILTSLSLSAQTLVLDSVVTLPSAVIESSGLIFFNNQLITHTDSDGENALYVIDTLTGLISRTVYIENATNKDWEDISQDDDYIYIGDFGNNQGNRTDLLIYKVLKQDFINSTNDSISAEIIFFSYEDQTNFNNNSQTNFDAEALISYNDSLYIFSKNWGNQETKIYSLSKQVGTQSAHFISTYDVNTLITGASFNSWNSTIYLSAYTNIGNPKIIELKDFTSTNFFNGTVDIFNADLKGSVQIEAICNTSQYKYYVSSEKFIITNSVLSTFSLAQDTDTLINNVLDFDEFQTVLFPNPASKSICANSNKISELILLNNLAQNMKQENRNCINLENIESGIYYLKLIFKDKTEQILKFRKQ